jgi:hypothetical protein
MSKYGFDYFVSRSHLLQEMAPPTKLFGNNLTLNNWIIRVKGLLKKGDLEELQKLDPSFDSSSEESQLNAKLGPGRDESAYKVAAIKAILSTIQDISPIESTSIQEIPSIIKKLIEKMLTDNGVDDISIEFNEDDLTAGKDKPSERVNSLFSAIADNTGMGDAVRSLFNQLKSTPIAKSTIPKIEVLLTLYSDGLDEDLTTISMDPMQMVKYYVGNTGSGDWNHLIKMLVDNGVFDNLDTDKIIKNTSLEKMYKYLLTTEKTSRFAAGQNKLKKDATGEHKDELRKKTYSILPKIRELNHKTKMFKFRGIVPKGDIDVRQIAKESDELPFDLEYIQSIVKILDKAYRLKESGDYLDTNARTFDATVSMYAQAYDFKISRIFLEALLPSDFKALWDMFSGIEKGFKSKQVSYTSDDFEKNINELSQKIQSYKSAPQILNFLNAIKFFLNRIEPQSTESDDDIDNDVDEVGGETLPYPEYNPEIFYSVFKTEEDQELFDYWYKWKQKEKEAIKNNIRKKYTTEAGKDIQSKQPTPRYDAEERAGDLERYSKIKNMMDRNEDEQHQESYTSMYMNEQVERDKLFNPRGEFKERGFKKPLNYWHWSQKD